MLKKSKNTPLNEASESRLFTLFAARVGQIDFIHSLRVDKELVYAKALAEAREALNFYVNHITEE